MSRSPTTSCCASSASTCASCTWASAARSTPTRRASTGPAWARWLIGAAFYLWLYNPITLETQAAFSVITASLPAAIVAAVVYLLLTRVIYRKRAFTKAG